MMLARTKIKMSKVGIFAPKGDGRSGPQGPPLPEKLNILVHLILKRSFVLS